MTYLLRTGTRRLMLDWAFCARLIIGKEARCPGYAHVRERDRTDGGHGQVLPQPTPFWGRPITEYRWQLKVLKLLPDPLWRGNDVSRSDGAPVLLVPGFLGGDPWLSLLRGWLRRVGYRSYRADTCWNVDCTEDAMQRLERRLQHAVGRTIRPVVVAGHSRGVLFGRHFGLLLAPGSGAGMQGAD